ncbi:MAG: ester cyclase [Oscillibacter sp.]|nr:ester cyclase [Oscillibacter sp.]
MGKFSAAKKVVLDYFEAMEACSPDQCAAVLKKFVSESYFFRGVYPFEEQYGAEDVAAAFWKPLKQSLGHMQRRMDVFLGGYNKYGDQEIWVLSTGNFMGLFDRDWPGIKSTAKMNCLRYTEFHCVEKGKITKTTLFVDILGFMQMAGVNPLPPQTGKFFVYPGPRMHNGLLFEDAPEAEGQKTMRLINRLCAEEPEYVDERADTLDYTGMTEGEIQYIKNCKRYFADDMIWYGPCGIGASYTLLRYTKQHATPFNDGLSNYRFNGHLVRVAEGEFGGFFGWPNLTNTPAGGYLGMVGSNQPVNMRVVDVYWRRGDRLAENWVYIDFLYWFKQQGLDLLERTNSILNP